MIVLLATSLPVFAQTNAEPGEALPASPGSLVSVPSASPSSPDGWLSPGIDPQNKLGKPFLQHLVADQKQFWTTPFSLDSNSKKTLIPFVGFTGVLFASDDWLSKQVPDKPDQLNRSSNISNYAVYSLIGAGGGAYLWGHITNNDHLKETGLLSGEAVLNSTAVSYVLKGITQRPRPSENQGSGFFQGGMSFPSEHSAAAWSIASVIAHEYPGPLTQFLAYGLASTVTLTRVTSQNHFPSDAFVGSVLGWYLGRQIYRAHHDTTLPGGAWGPLLEEKHSDGSRDPRKMGSPYVSLDSWIYPALERLVALGYIQTAYLGMRPWTRMECARMLEEVGENMRTKDQANSEAHAIFNSLMTEFSIEGERLNGGPNVGLSVDSVYTRVTGIAGTPLRDSYHFAQTITNDYGRPYAEGISQIAGLTTYAVVGPMDFSIQGEYQHSPQFPSYPLAVLQATAAQDGTLPLPNGHDTVNQFALIDAAVGFTFRNTRISFGKESLDLGPARGGGLLMTNNAPPIPMLHVEQVSPIEIPGVSKLMGPIRFEFFLGQLAGHHWISANKDLIGPYIDPQPYVHGTKLSFKPTPNIEFGFAATVLFGGPTLPFTWHNFWRTFYSNAVPGTGADAGDRRSTFDFSYRVPYLRDWLTVYADSLVEDEISPLASTRPSMRMGVYMPKVPQIPKLDLRLEGVYTDVPGQQPTGFIYANGRYRSGYTNDGQLLADWIGRQGRGGQGLATYWLSPRSKFQLTYRHAEVSKEFIGGGRLNDYGGAVELMVKPNLSISGLFQYEQWKFPVISNTGESNVTASVQLTFYPNWRIRK